MKLQRRIIHRSPTPPPSQYHRDKRRAPRSRDRQALRKEWAEY